MTVVADVIAELKGRLVGVGGVQGIGVTQGSPERVVVYVDKITPALKQSIPPVLAGYGVQIEEVGQVRAL
jgi:hypothetical protein